MLSSVLNELIAALQDLSQTQLPPETKIKISQALTTLDSHRRSLQKHTEQDRLAALYRLSHMLGSSLDLDEVLTQVMDLVIHLTQAERGFLMLVNEDTPGLTLQAARNIRQEDLQSDRMQVSRTVIDTVLESGQGVVTTDAQSDPRFAEQESVIIYALRSIMCAPLNVRGQVIGAIYVDNRAQTALFDQADLDLLSTFAAQAAIAIENARLYARTDRALAQRIAELEMLSRIDQQLNSSLDLEQVLETTCTWAKETGHGSQAWIYLSQAETSALHLSAGPAENAPPMHLFDQVKKTGITQETQQGFLLITPLVHTGVTIGWLIVQSDAPFSPNEQQFISRLAGRAAAAIANARLYLAVQEANLAKSEFVSIVSHELRTPMTSIKGYTDLLRQGIAGDITEQQLSFLNIIRSNVGRMSSLVSDLADISRIETGRLKLKLSALGVKESISECLLALRPRYEKKGITIENHLPAAIPEIWADKNRLAQVLTNLLSNAIKYTPQGGKITIGAFHKDESIHISVKDTGIGISPEDQTHIFDQFFRSEDPVVRDEPGWGLGLSVTRLLVEQMGGEIGFESVPGEGSTFWFTLPSTRE